MLELGRRAKAPALPPHDAADRHAAAPSGGRDPAFVTTTIVAPRARARRADGSRSTPASTARETVSRTGTRASTGMPSTSAISRRDSERPGSSTSTAPDERARAPARALHGAARGSSRGRPRPRRRRPRPPPASPDRRRPAAVGDHGNGTGRAARLRARRPPPPPDVDAACDRHAPNGSKRDAGRHLDEQPVERLGGGLGHQRRASRAARARARRRARRWPAGRRRDRRCGSLRQGHGRGRARSTPRGPTCRTHPWGTTDARSIVVPSSGDARRVIGARRFTEEVPGKEVVTVYVSGAASSRPVSARRCSYMAAVAGRHATTHARCTAASALCATSSTPRRPAASCSWSRPSPRSCGRTPRRAATTSSGRPRSRSASTDHHLVAHVPRVGERRA